MDNSIEVDQQLIETEIVEFNINEISNTENTVNQQGK